ncbi:tripartite tricarboxylate transporter TctB family protein [Sphaerochaeta sp.]|uniref:tripartite tricarboxylate transporter TctB family protein n=1 Tax=Sphaerochaeta sp. TaxID=1972642 RepID=UPI002FC69FC7
MEPRQAKPNRSTYIEGLVFLAFSIALLIYALFNHYQNDGEWKQSPYLFPLLIALFFLPLAVVLLRQGKAEGKKQNSPATLQYKDTAIVALTTLIYMAVMPVVGFLGSSVIFLAVLIWYLGERNTVRIILISILFPLVMYVLFARMLHVMLP